MHIGSWWYDMVELKKKTGAGNTGGSIALTGTVTFTAEAAGSEQTVSPVLLTISEGWS